MPGSVIGKKLNLGYAGKVSRSNDRIVINRLYEANATNKDPILFGAPVFLDSAGIHGAVTASTAAQFVGIAAASVVQADVYSDANDGGAYKPGKPMDILVRGTVTVLLNASTAQTAGAPVYYDVANAVFTGSAKTGETNNLEVPGAHFATGYVDANKCAEIVLTKRNLI